MKFVAVIALALVSWIASAQSPCPGPLSASQLQKLRDDDSDMLRQYALMRWFKCGWPTAVPAMKAWRSVAEDAAREDAALNGDALPTSTEFVDDLRMMVWMNPEAFDQHLSDEFTDEPNEDDPMPLVALMQLRVDPAQMLRHIERGRAAATAFLREDLSLPAATDMVLELSVVAQQIRAGRIEEARAHFNRVERHWMARDPQSSAAVFAASDRDEEAVERLNSMRAVLAPVAPVGPVSGATAPGRWIVNRSKTARWNFCGSDSMMENLFDTTYLRDAVLRAADADAAIAEVLPADWHAQVEGGGMRTGLLMELLRKRYGKAELRQGWADALASLRADGARAGIVLFGHDLALPDMVVEDDAATPAVARVRPFRSDEFIELVKATAIYRSSHAD